MKEVALIFVSACLVMPFLYFFAHKIGLLDKPNNRKKHKGNIPLIGGISFYISIFILFISSRAFIPYFSIYILCISILFVIGILDDRFDLPVLPRIFAQVLVAGIMVYCGLYFDDLGYILFGYQLSLGMVCGSLVTLLAVCGAINSFNMIDGIDGLLGTLSSISIAALGVVFYLGNNYSLALFCLCIIAALIPYIILNTGVILGRKYKIFMGDAGSTLIGFTVVWLLIFAVENNIADNLVVMNPVTALWIIAVPLIDMIGVMLRRIHLGRSPFKPDRKHLHHIFMRAGFNSKQTLLIISVIALFLASIGVVSEWFKVHESVMFVLFLVLLCLYIWSLKHIWKLLVRLRRRKSKFIN